MSPEELSKAAEVAQAVAVRDYTFSGLLFLVLAGGFYLLRVIILRFFAHQERRDVEFAKGVEALKVWSEGFVTAIGNGAAKISNSIESFEESTMSAWHEHEMLRANADREIRDSERELMREKMREERDRASGRRDPKV